MKNTRVINTVLILMLLLNVAFLGSWWFGHWRAHRMMKEEFVHEGHESKATMFMVKELGFSDVQVEQLKALRKDHFQKIESMDAAVMRNEKNMMAALMTNPIDTVHANMYADSVGMLKAAMQKELFRHFEGIKKICTPEQSSKFDHLVEEMSKEFPHHWDMHHAAGEMHHDSM